MVKKIILLGVVCSTVLGADEPKNIYEKNCIPCHRYAPASLEKLFMVYLKSYSGELSVKGTIKAFLKNPKESDSKMNNTFIENFSVKDKTTLTDEELEEAIDIYWELYDVRKKLK